MFFCSPKVGGTKIHYALHNCGSMGIAAEGVPINGSASPKYGVLRIDFQRSYIEKNPLIL